MNTYSSLKQSIADWLARDDLASYIDGFIDIAEARVGLRLRIRAMETTATLSTVAGQDYVALPTGFAGIRGVYRDGSPQSSMSYYTPEQLNSIANTSRAPYAFTIRGDNMVFAGPSDSVYEVELHYYQKFTALSDSNTSNWLTENAPQVLLYAALQAAAEFIRDNEQAERWSALFVRALAEVESADEGDKFGPAPRMMSESTKW